MDAPGWYVAAVLLTAGLITFALRAIPFLIVERLRDSQAVAALAAWTPPGILLILALVTCRATITAEPGSAAIALVAALVTVIVHVAGGRRTLVSVAAGTLTYVLLINALM